MLQNSLNQQDQPQEQDPRESNIMGDSAAMTVEFLRARLLSERSVSKTARQRADELAKRVAELEEQLKLVSLQRKKAEKATTEVLTILENYGMTEFSEDFSWSSDEEDSTHCESRMHNKSMKSDDSHDTLEGCNNDVVLGSEIEASPICGRSLSWKSSKNSPHSHEKQQQMSNNTSRRRSSFSSTVSASPKQRIGRSCRQIRRRETRSSVEELDTETSMISSQANSNCCEFGSGVSREGSENQEEKLSLEDPVLGSTKNHRDLSNAAGSYLIGHGSDRDMESALEHQAQLIGQYEAEEKAQRDWEDKYKENNSSNTDSCEHGNQSDVTEEREEEETTKAAPVPPPYPPPQPPPPPPVDDDDDNDANSKMVGDDDDVSFNKKESHESHHPTSSSGGFTFPLANKDNKQSKSSSSALSQDAVSTPAGKKEVSVSRLERRQGDELLSLKSPHRTTTSTSTSTSDNNLGSILEALQQAKLSLAQKLEDEEEGEGSIGKANETTTTTTTTTSVPTMMTRAVGGGGMVEVPVGCTTGLFRVPTTDYFHFETTSRPRPNYNNRSLLDYNNQTAAGGGGGGGDRFITNRMGNSSNDNRFLTMMTATSNNPPYMDMESSSRYGFPATSGGDMEGLQQQFHDHHPRFNVGSVSSYKVPFGPHLDMNIHVPSHSSRNFNSLLAPPNLDTARGGGGGRLLTSSSGNSNGYNSPYPYLIPQMPSFNGRFSRPQLSSGESAPPPTYHHYNNHSSSSRPNMFK